MKTEYLVVGSGINGATIARLLKDSAKCVEVVERRSHLGGNVHDYLFINGIRIHTYGPHYFRTSSDKIWSFVNKFSDFFKYEARLVTKIDSTLEAWPVVESYIEKHCGKDWIPGFWGKAENFEEASLSKMPAVVYEKFVKGYTEKHWGVQAK